MAGGVGAVAWFLTRPPLPFPIGRPLALAWVAAPAAALAIAVLWSLGAGVPSAAVGGGRRGDIVERLRRGAGVAWPAALPLWLLPASGGVADVDRLVVLGMVATSAGLLWMRTAREPRSEGAGLFAERGSSIPGVWEAALLVVAVAVALHYLCTAADAQGNADNDAAYYFGVARHMLRSGRFEEPIVWHFLSRPEHVLHRPFDYWQGMTSLLLLPAMSLFGATHRVALVTMGALSAVTVLLFWYLIAVAAPFRRRIVQLVALLTFALSPALATYRFDTESIVVFHLFVLVVLIAFVRGRHRLCALGAFALVLTRSDGAIVCALVWAALLWRARTAGRLRPLLTAMVATAAAYAVICLVSFGAPTPPGAARALLLPSRDALYQFGAPASLPRAQIVARFALAALEERAWVALNSLRTIAFVPHQEIWAAFMLLPGAAALVGRARGIGLAAVILFVASPVIAWAAPVTFFHWRTLFTMLPLFVLVGAAGLDAVIERLLAWQSSGGRPRLRGVMASAASIAVLMPIMAPLQPYGTRAAKLRGLETELAELDRALAGKPVMSSRPWQVIANTSSPAIMIPSDGEEAMKQAAEAYGANHLLVDESCVGASAAVCGRIWKGTQHVLWNRQLTLVLDRPHIKLFHIDAGLRDP